MNITHFIWEWVWLREGTLQSGLKGSLVETKRREKSRLHKEDNRRKILPLCSRNKDPFKDHPGGRRKNVRWIRRKSPKKEEKRCYFSNSDTTLWQLGQKHWMGEKKGKKFLLKSTEQRAEHMLEETDHRLCRLQWEREMMNMVIIRIHITLYLYDVFQFETR